MSESAGQRPYLLPVQRWGRAAFPIPDGIRAVLFAVAAATNFRSDDLIFGLMVEGAFLLMQGTLVDIASRLRKRPPVWAIALIAGGVLLFSSEAQSILRYAWGQGLVVFVPLLLSLGERATILWHLPVKTRVQKIAARALIANRITTALALFALLTVMLLADMIFGHIGLLDAEWAPLTAGALYFGIAAFDDWRVRGARFAEQPTVLFRFDPLHITHLDPL